jgi:arylsulfatase A-like enzyme
MNNLMTNEDPVPDVADRTGLSRGRSPLLVRVAGTAVLAFSMIAPVVGAEPGARPPNVVVILADDLGYRDLSCYGGAIPTPHLDRLAAEGMRFTDFHSNGVSCSPTRAALLTGRYPQRSGIEAALPFGPDHGLPRQRTLPAALREAGYATGVVGKWHLGEADRFLPTHFGFDEFRGLLSGDGDHHTRIARPGWPDWWFGDQAVREEGYTTHLITKHSVDFIERNRTRPFFLYVAHLVPHFPWQGPDDPGDRVEGTDYRPGELKFGTRNDKRAAFREMVRELDRSVGEIVRRLKELNLDRHTLVVFTSDNGGYTVDRGGYVAVSDHGVFRGEKGQTFEGGHRVPTIAAWPGRIPAGTVNHGVALTMDLTATVVDVAGLAGGAVGVLDGLSLTDTLFGGNPLPRRTLFWRQNRNKAARDGSLKFVVEGNREALFDLVSDPGETKDLSSQRPEDARRLKQALAAWEDDVARSHRELVAQ